MDKRGSERLPPPLKVALFRVTSVLVPRIPRVITLLRAFLTPCHDLYEYTTRQEKSFRTEKVPDGSVRNWPCLAACLLLTPPRYLTTQKRLSTPPRQGAFIDLHVVNAFQIVFNRSCCF